MNVGVAYGAAETRIRATVSVVTPKVTASAQGVAVSAAIVASKQQSALVKLAAAVQHVIPAAALQHVFIVLDVVLDPIGRNPILKDIFAVADTTRLGVGKRFYEVQSTGDAKTLVFTKGLVETKITTETRTFSLQRSIADAVLVTDDFYGNANIDDDQVMVFSKALSVEQQTVSDSASVSAGKRATDTVSKADVQYRDFSKGLADIPVTSEVRTAYFEKALADMVDAGDEFNAVALTDDGEVMLFGKTLTETLGALDAAVVEAGKGVADAATVGDELLPFDLGKGVFDTPLTFETLGFDSSKPLDDAVAFSDAAPITLAKPVFDRTYYPADGPNQYDTYALSYFLEDYVREGFPAISFTKALADTVYSTDDFFGAANVDDDETMLFGKGLNDLALSSDYLRYSVGKSLTDLFGTSDAATISASKALTDSFTKSDSATKGTGKSVADVFASSEIVVRNTGKGASDIAATADNKTFALSKSLSDTATATDDFLGNANTDDDETMAFTKVVGDSFTKSDSVSLGPNKGLADSASTSESGSIVWTDYWDITYTVTTSGMYVGNSQTF